MATITRASFTLAIALMMAPASLQVHQQPGDSYPQGQQVEPNPMLEILPASFVGCWRGIVTAPDSQQALNGCIAGPFVPELYTLCYRHKLAGRFELTFSGVSMDTAVPADYALVKPQKTCRCSRVMAPRG